MSSFQVQNALVNSTTVGQALSTNAAKQVYAISGSISGAMASGSSYLFTTAGGTGQGTSTVNVAVPANAVIIGCKIAATTSVTPTAVVTVALSSSASSIDTAGGNVSGPITASGTVLAAGYVIGNATATSTAATVTTSTTYLVLTVATASITAGALTATLYYTM